MENGKRWKRWCHSLFLYASLGGVCGGMQGGAANILVFFPSPRLRSDHFSPHIFFSPHLLSAGPHLSSDHLFSYLSSFSPTCLHLWYDHYFSHLLLFSYPHLWSDHIFFNFALGNFLLLLICCTRLQVRPLLL